MAAGDLSQDPTVLLAEIVELQAQVARRQAALAVLAARAGQAPAEPLIDTGELARLLGAGRRAMSERLRQERWSWLRDLGELHRDGRGPRWRWSEVEAARAARRGT